MLFGLCAFSCLCFPVCCGAIAYFLLRLFGNTHATIAAEAVAVASTAIVPIYLIGHALEKSYSLTDDSNTGPVELTPAWPQLSLERRIDVWKECIEVQRHFNDLELRIRNFAVTVLVGVLGATAFALKEHYQITILGAPFPLSVSILFAGALGWLGFYFMDRHWYHRLLLGSVFHTIDVEKTAGDASEYFALTQRIGLYSPISEWRFKIHSTQKIDIFYGVGLALIVILAGLLLFATSPTVTTNTNASQMGPSPQPSSMVDASATGPAIQRANTQAAPPNRPKGSAKRQRPSNNKHQQQRSVPSRPTEQKPVCTCPNPQ